MWHNTTTETNEKSIIIPMQFSSHYRSQLRLKSIEVVNLVIEIQEL